MKTQLATAFESQKIDRAAGIIFGVSVITEGEARGHGFEIDAKTLTGVLACASAFADGVRVKIEHGTGFESIVGTLREFRIDGPQLRADLHLILSHARTASILEMAEKMPGGFGLSIAFSGIKEKLGDVSLARCQELYSVDLVDMPAANPNGLFSARVDSVEIDNMATIAENKTGFIEALKEFFTPVNEANPLVKLEANFATAQAEIVTLKAAVAQRESELETIKLSVLSLTKELDELAAKIADPKGEIAAQAAKAALSIAAGQGIAAPVAIAPEGRSEQTFKARKEFSALSAQEQMKFIKSGGKITE